MRIAVLHWHTSSVGGINTTLENFRAVADKRGDTFHVLASDNQRTKVPQVFPARKRVRGGDSFIWIDGYAPHHYTNFGASAEFLADYDVVLTSFLCPHPTKAYGDVPVFMELLKQITGRQKKPLIGYIHDAYWDSYADWGRETAKLCKKIVVCQAAYAEPILKLKARVIVAYPPFYPFLLGHTAPRAAKRVLWIPQWKNIKGIHKFLAGVPELIKKNPSLHLYNNGIEYYKARLEPFYREIVGSDLFAPTYSGDGKAVFHGCVPIKDVYRAIAEAGFVCDFQGHAAKYAAYLNGSYNHTLAETLYYGAVPVVHSNILKSGIPEELVLPVSDLKDYPKLIANYKDTEKRRAAAKKYVMKHFSAEALYDKIFSN